MSSAEVNGRTGRLAYMPEPGRLEFREYDLPSAADLPEGGMLLRSRAAGVCGSELHMFAGRHPLLRSMALGHELVAEVTELSRRERDSAGTPLQPGDRVSVVYYLTCNECRACSRGEFALCEKAYSNWSQSPDLAPHFRGTHATHYYVDPRQWIYKVPDNVSDLISASANCGLSQVWAGAERADLKPGEWVVVQGAGGLGLYATAVAKERGAHVIVIDSVALRLQNARAFGADATIDMSEAPEAADRIAQVQDLTAGEGADVGFDLAGVPAALEEGLELLRTGGRYIEIGNVSPGITVPLDVGRLTRRAVSILPVIRYHPGMLQEALQFLSRNVGRLPFERLLDAEYPFERLEDALKDSEARTVTRAVLTFS